MSVFASTGAKWWADGGYLSRSIDAITAPVLDWDDDTADATPDFTVSLTSPLTNDVVTLTLYSDAGLTTPVATDANTLDAAEVLAGSINFAIGSQADGTYYAQVTHARTGWTTGTSNTETVTIATGSLAPLFLLMAA